MKSEVLSQKDSPKKLNCILLIEDNEFINIYNRRIIEQLDITDCIKVMEDGQEAMDYLTREAKFVPNGHTGELPDMILLDLNMPRLNGWEFIQEYRKIKSHLNKPIVIVILSTSPNPDDVKRSEQMPEIAAFVSKPLTREVLGKLVERYFESK